MSVVDDLTRRIDELAGLMDEFQLDQAEWKTEGGRVAMRRAKKAVVAPVSASPVAEFESNAEALSEPETSVAAPAPSLGTPVTSPMNGIYYGSPSPNAPAFVQVGDPVTAGQVVCLIEAMKVFNDITAPVSGTVTKLVVESGKLVEPGEALLYIG